MISINIYLTNTKQNIFIKGYVDTEVIFMSKKTLLID